MPRKKYATALYNEISQDKPKFVRPSRPARNSVVNVSGLGQPAIYDNHRFPHIAKTLCAEYGFTHYQLSKTFGVSVDTVNSWVSKYPDFKIAVKSGRDQFDSTHVENKLLQLALGFEYEEKSVKTVSIRGVDAEGNKIRIPAKETVVTTKQNVPNIKAIMFWLTNRDPERWKMVTTVNANINATSTKKTINMNADLSKMDTAQLRTLRDLVSTQSHIDVESSVIDESSMLEYINNAKSLMDAEDYELGESV